MPAESTPRTLAELHAAFGVPLPESNDMPTHRTAANTIPLDEPDWEAIATDASTPADIVADDPQPEAEPEPEPRPLHHWEAMQPQATVARSIPLVEVETLQALRHRAPLSMTLNAGNVRNFTAAAIAEFIADGGAVHSSAMSRAFDLLASEVIGSAGEGRPPVGNVDQAIERLAQLRPELQLNVTALGTLLAHQRTAGTFTQREMHAVYFHEPGRIDYDPPAVADGWGSLAEPEVQPEAIPEGYDERDDDDEQSTTDRITSMTQGALVLVRRKLTEARAEREQLAERIRGYVAEEQRLARAVRVLTTTRGIPTDIPEEE